MKIVALSDLHGYLPDVKTFPECDVVCICGDICPLDYQNSTVKCISWFCLDFTPWANSLPCDKVIFVGGNHDFFLEDVHKRVSSLGIKELTWRSPSEVMKHLLVGSHKGASKLVYLCDNSYEYKGVKFYGTPWIADLSRWAFYKNTEELKAKYDNIPKKVDVLLTHMPAATAYVGDVLQHGCFNTMASYGSVELSDAILARDIKWALCGHVHSGNHKPTEVDGTTFVNVSLKDEDYKVSYNLFEFEV